ncbi:MAG: homoserine dehydrogenase [Rickettsiales bacterium]|nr:homoserine dehydrogenase [Rickettsiales bacterium]
MTHILNIAIAGLGTVGCGVAKILQAQESLLELRCAQRLELVAVSARDQAKKRDFSLGKVRFEADALALAVAPDVDVVVELIGGAEGIARALVTQALENGKHVVTANKALIAAHGAELAALAESKGVALCYEAAVAGGIPIIKMLREGLAANRYVLITAILNGTCNYILTTMEKSGRDFADVLAEAQEKGYAEADPSFDIDGVDSAHKLAIIAALAFQRRPNLASLHIEGIRSISKTDIHFARELGYRIKLLGITSQHEGGEVEQRVHPCMIPLHSPLANVDDVYNAVQIEGDAVGRLFIEGRGAGAGPTASAVVADLIDVARGHRMPPLMLPASTLAPLEAADISGLRGEYYLRLTVVDRPGVLADIAGICRDQGISVASLIQHAHSPEEPVDIVLTTHHTPESKMQRALREVATLATLMAPPQMIRIQAP